LLEWKGSINPLASGIKCSWNVTTVSNSYLYELRRMSNGLEQLFEYEKGKCTGILNGIDYTVWDPSNDKYLTEHFSMHDADAGKERNKHILCEKFGLDPRKPLFVFIGRLVGEKGADLLPKAIADSFKFIGRKMNFLVLGNGEASTEAQLTDLKSIAKGDYNEFIGYNETLSHLMYAGADFLVMPSRVEPCGLNQLYAMRYGTIPVVRSTGGLKDTVIDIGETGGYGITFNHAAVGDITHGIYRAVALYNQKEVFRSIRQKIMSLDFSWHRSAAEYVSLYQSFQ
jgi:starch synthase